MSISERQHRPNINADNSGHGNWYIVEGAGDQNAVYGNGTSRSYSQHSNSKFTNIFVEFPNSY